MAYVGLGQALFDPNIVQAPPPAGTRTGADTGWVAATQKATGYTEAQKAEFARLLAAEVAKQQAAKQTAVQSTIGGQVSQTNAIAFAASLNLPKCVTQAEKDAASNDCRMASLRGLSGPLGAWTYPSGRFKGADPCWVQSLPICKPPTLRPRPEDAAKKPPTLREPPRFQTSTETAAGGLSMGALLLIAVAVGGTGYYLYKRSRKTAKAA